MVRLVPLLENHCGAEGGCGGRRHFFGSFIEVCLPPLTPGLMWNCGTRYVWKLTPQQVEKIVGRKPTFEELHTCVCEHMIEVD